MSWKTQVFWLAFSNCLLEKVAFITKSSTSFYFSITKPLLNPESVQQLISPNSDMAESFTKIMRIKEMIATPKKLWLFNKFSLSVLKETYKEEYGEGAFWCKGVEG